MRNGLKGVGRRLKQLKLSQRLIIGLVLVVVIVILVSGVPANIAMWRQLEQQVWEQVEHGQDATQALYQAETARLKKLAGLFAGRPTLQRLVEQGNLSELESYLEQLQVEGGNLDAALVVTPDFMVGDQLEGLPAPGEFLAGHEPYFADIISLQDPPRLYIVATSQIQPAAEEAQSLGWVVLVRQQQSAEMQEMEQETGLAQSLIVGESRVATSLPGDPIWALDMESAIQAETRGQHSFMRGRLGSEYYYVGLIPMRDSQGNMVAVSEVALAGSAIRRDMIGTLILSGTISLGVMLLAALVVVRLARTITRPLADLSQAAERISQGNLEVPSPANSGLPEIDQLARHFDQARLQLRQTLAVAENEMKHAQRLLASVREGVVAINPEGRITYFNSDAEEILGYHASEVLHRPCNRIFPPAPGERLSLQDALCHAAGDLAPQRVNILDAHGNPLLLSVHVSFLENDLGSSGARERVLLIRDVTEEEAVNQLRYNFLANVAHEFRTPLAGIAATSELLVEDSASLSPEELTELVEMIKLSTLHLQTLVDNLLESTTIEAGCFKVNRRPVNFLEIAQKAVDIMSPLLKRREQELVVHAPEDLPTLWADSTRLTQVLVNLLSNASKFCPPGETIELALAQEDGCLSVSVLDCGPGLPAGIYADLFKRFVTSGQQHGTQYGIGLGLSVVKAIIETHHGQVGAENRPQGGAKVWFTIPFHPPEELKHP